LWDAGFIRVPQTPCKQPHSPLKTTSSVQSFACLAAIPSRSRSASRTLHFSTSFTACWLRRSARRSIRSTCALRRSGWSGDCAIALQKFTIRPLARRAASLPVAQTFSFRGPADGPSQAQGPTPFAPGPCTAAGHHWLPYACRLGRL